MIVCCRISPKNVPLFLLLPATGTTGFIPPRSTKFLKTWGSFGDAIVCGVYDTVYDILYCFGDVRGTNHGLCDICQLHELFPVCPLE
ncbi:hypothetical protein AVEN_34539-1 [Araneus ventricosus]|uniref:Uncharacterized protein n=1 Tax=Araneus ventricosus TaxID=182803 RepID=A0A4Y2TBF8_ARAVE|nr:hypothetical protein AVEN_34539-1 [Araneus ventricosus]